jgi:hypothetical protein
MSDTNLHSAHPSEPVEADGVNYGGIGWFVVVLVVTVVAAQLVVWGVFEWFDYRVTRSDAPRALMADPPSNPALEGGRLVSGAETSPSPALLVDEPVVLRDFRRAEDEALRSYGWIDQSLGTVRLPIDRAKDLVIERGLPVRPEPAGASQP